MAVNHSKIAARAKLAKYRAAHGGSKPPSAAKLAARAKAAARAGKYEPGSDSLGNAVMRPKGRSRSEQDAQVNNRQLKQAALALTHRSRRSIQDGGYLDLAHLSTGRFTAALPSDKPTAARLQGD